ncbi:hypothetical protein D9M71_689590 [compost metagenome]
MVVPVIVAIAINVEHQCPASRDRRPRSAGHIAVIVEAPAAVVFVRNRAGTVDIRAVIGTQLGIGAINEALVDVATPG